MNLRQQLSTRRDLTEAAQSASALKREYRAENARLVKEGRGSEIQQTLRRNLGIGATTRGRLVEVAGFSFK